MEGVFTPFSFLDKLTHEEREALRKISHPVLHKKTSYIFRADEMNDSLFVLLDGRVKISRLSPQGRELIQWFCLPGEIFGLSEDSNSHLRGLYAQALTETKTLYILKEDFEDYIQTQPHIALLVIKQLTSRLRTLGDTLLNITSDEADVRFIKLLQRLSKFHGRKCNDGIYVDIYLTHQEMADMIGACRQTVSSMIGKMQRKGILVVNRNGITIKSPDVITKTSPLEMELLQTV